MTPEQRLLKRVRVLAQHAETVSAAARTIIRELTAAEAVGTPVDARKVERRVRRIEARLRSAAREQGVTP
jgi:transcriptional regulator NrdR family protein